MHAPVPSAERILADLVAIPSENPGGSEREIADYCVALLSRAGLDIEVVADDPSRPNVIARLTGRTGRKIVYQGHLDTKPAFHAGTSRENWSRDPFQPTIEDGILYGLGACDTKGGVAAQLSAMARLARTWTPDLPTLEWQGVADEENGSTFGCGFLAQKRRLHADLAIIAEPTGGQLSFEQLGSVWTTARVVGRAAHGGMPWLGADAIAAGLELVDRVRTRVRARRLTPQDHHPDLGVRILNGGGHAGTVGASLTIVSDIRVRPGEDRELFRQIWREEARAIAQGHDVRVEIEPYLDGGCEPNALGSPLLRAALLSAWRRAVGAPGEPHLFHGGSDARFFAAAETPTLVLGPGDLAHAHAPDERVALAQVATCEAFLAACPRLLSFPPVVEAARCS